MSNVIDFKTAQNEEFKYCSYWESDSDVGVAMLDKSIIMLPCSTSEIEFLVGDTSILFKREELAEFINVAKVFIDSEDKFMPEVEMVGLNYK